MPRSWYGPRPPRCWGESLLHTPCVRVWQLKRLDPSTHRTARLLSGHLSTAAPTEEYCTPAATAVDVAVAALRASAVSGDALPRIPVLPLGTKPSMTSCQRTPTLQIRSPLGIHVTWLCPCVCVQTVCRPLRRRTPTAVRRPCPRTEWWSAPTTPPTGCPNNR